MKGIERMGVMARMLLLLSLLLCPLVSAQDELTVTETGGQVASVIYTWTSDGSGSAIGHTVDVLPGVLFSAWAEPGEGAEQPTSGYDIVIKQVFDSVGGSPYYTLPDDLATGELEDQSNTAGALVTWFPTTIRTVSGKIRIQVSNAGSGKTGRVVLAVARHLALRQHDVQLVAGSPGQLFQYQAPGLGQWVTMSGDATMAVGGEVTITGGGGTGDMLKVGTPVDGQLGVWTGDGTMEGDPALTFDTTDDTLVISASGKLGFGAVDVLSDASGTTTLSNIDALNATTESTIESAIDTLANLTSIQGQSFTVAGTTSVTGTNTGDQTITLQGDVTGTGTGTFTTTIAAGAVDLAMLSATGTKDATTFYRGDNTFALPPVTLTNTATLTNKRITKRSGSTASSATPTINTDAYDFYALTALATDITSMSSGLSGTPVQGDKLWLSFTGTAERGITWGASFEDGAVALPTTTISTQRLDVGLIWNTVSSKWRCMAAGPLE